MSTPATSGAPAGSRRFWITVLCFALTNAAVWGVLYRCVLSRHPALLSIDRFEPKDGAVVGPRAVFTWHFNLDVLPPLPDAAPPGVISPAVQGHWKFSDARTLVFTPDADLPKATRLTVSLPAERLRTAQGFQLDKTFTSTVQTPSLELTSLRQASFTSDNRMLIALEFSDRVLPADVTQRLSIRTADARAIRFTPHGEAAGKIIRVMTDPIPLPDERPADLHVVVELKPGLTGMSGPLPIAQPIERHLAISAELMATRVHAHTPAEGDATIAVSFNNPVEADALHDVISVEPAIPFRLTSSGDSAELIGAFQPGTRYAVKIAGSAATQRPKSWVEGRRYPKPDTLSVLVPDRDARVWFEHDEGYLGSRGHRTLLAHAVNQWDLKVTVSRVYDNNLVAWRNGRNGRDASSYSQPIAIKKFRLAKAKNKLQDLALSLDDLLPAGVPNDGVYRVAISTDGSGADDGDVRFASDEPEEDAADFTDRYANATAMVTLSDLGVTAKQSHDGVVAWVVSLSTGKPVAGARLRLFSNKNQLLGEALTDGDGVARIDKIHPAPGEQPTVLLASLERGTGFQPIWSGILGSIAYSRWILMLRRSTESRIGICGAGVGACSGFGPARDKKRARGVTCHFLRPVSPRAACGSARVRGCAAPGFSCSSPASPRR